MSKKSKNETDIQKLAELYIKTKDPDDFGKLYFRIKYGLRSYIYDIVNNVDYVDEVETIVLEKIWKNIHMYDPDKAKFSTWLYRIAFFDSIQYITRKTRKQQNILSEDIRDIYTSTIAGDNYTTSNSIIFQEDFDLVLRNDGQFEKFTKDDLLEDLADASINCINELPDMYRLILQEKFINLKTIVQIAEDNNIPTTTVKNRLFHGRRLLKERMLKKHKNLYNLYINFENDI